MNRRELCQEFWKHLDESRLLRIVLKMGNPVNATLPHGWSRVGEGRHFYTLAEKTGAFPFAVSIAKESLRRKLVGGARQRWVDHINTMGREGGPLLPPMKAVALDEDLLVLIMPLGTERKDRGASAAIATPEEIAELKSHLKSKHLEINDVLQFKTYESVAFLCDFSDLQALEFRL